MKKQITICIKEWLIYKLLNSKIEPIGITIKKLQTIANTKGYTDITVSAETVSAETSSSGPTICFWGSRIETDKECEKRLEQEKIDAATNKRIEKRIETSNCQWYLELKKKFGD